MCDDHDDKAPICVVILFLGKLKILSLGRNYIKNLGGLVSGSHTPAHCSVHC